MIIFPAIDLKDGAAVRLRQGEMDSATVFNSDPADQARKFRASGFEWLHVVDLNGAFEGYPVNRDTVADIVEAVDLRIQLGGGIRDLVTIESWLSAGIERVILGTIALKDPALVKEACREFPGRVVVGIDAKGGRVAVEGWAEVSEMLVSDLARSFEDAGVAAIVYTDIDRDGLLQGANVPATVALAEAISIPVIASGGVASLDDIAALQAVAHKGIEGVICGRALYDGRIKPAAALAMTSPRNRASAG